MINTFDPDYSLFRQPPTYATFRKNEINMHFSMNTRFFDQRIIPCCLLFFQDILHSVFFKVSLF